MDNQALRKKYQAQRSTQSATAIEQASMTILTALTALSEFKHAKKIGLYYPHAGEVDTRDLWLGELDDNKKYYLPRIEKHPNLHLSFHRTHPESLLTKNQFSIPEPDPIETILTRALDIVICPLLAHTPDCHRIGTGCGYYDRTFAFKQQYPNNSPLLIGLAYTWQCVQEIHAQPWDVELDMIINPETIYRRKTPCSTGS